MTSTVSVATMVKDVTYERAIVISIIVDSETWAVSCGLGCTGAHSQIYAAALRRH